MTVQEWLGEDNQIGIDIWKKKYQYNNETFDEWLERVSGGDQDVRRLIKEKKFLFGGRILANRGLADNGKKVSYSNCFSGDTEIVTKDGIKKIGDLVDENIKVLSYGKWRDATVQNFGTQKLVALHLQKNRAKKTIYVTEDHVWYVTGQAKFVKKKTIELKSGDRIPVDVLKCYKSYKPSPFGVAHGAFYGDGDHVGKNRRMNFCGEKKELIDYFTPDTIGSSKDILTIYGIPKIFWGKRKPSLDETPSYLYGWLAGYFATDGSIDERGSCILTSSKREDLEFVQDVLAVLGIPCEEIRVQNRLSNLTNTYSDVYFLTLNKTYLNESFFVIKKDRDRFLENPPTRTSTWKVICVDTEDNKTDQVYCVVEPEKHSFTLKGNILTHNCYVISPPEDSIESIFDCAKKLARTYSYGGGCGIDISNLAPRGATIHNAAKTTTGSVSFMDLYSLITGLICQNGRRGALMISISCDHPDLEEFINIKSDLDKVTKANISIRITDKFMQAVKNREKFTLSFTRQETGETITKEINAYEFFHKICEMNWDYAEPGMLFWDRIENWNLLSCDNNFHYAGTNPCAEEPLPPGGSCLLSSINLSEFVNDDKSFNYMDFRSTVRIAVRALNDVLDEGLPLHPLQEQRDSVRDWRQIGLGIMGLADCLIKMGVRYGSKESILICNEIGNAMADEAIFESSELAYKQFGAYPNYNYDVISKSPFYIKNTTDLTKDHVKKYGLRNSQLLTIAPTGTLSTMLGISGGIEPIFANCYTRKTESLHGHDEYYKVYTPIVQKYMEEHNLTDESELPDYFVVATDLDFKERIDMQATWQKHIDASISSTVNVPNEFTVEQVEDLYMYAWEQGLKGVTIFRDGCKRTGILTTDDNGKTDSSEEKNTNLVTSNELPRGYIIKVDNNTVGKERHLQTGCGSLHVCGFFDTITGDLLEDYISKGSQGGCLSNLIGLSRLISYAARGGCDVKGIVDQLLSVPACPSYVARTVTKHDTSKGACCPNAIGYALLDMYEEMQDELGLKEDQNEEGNNEYRAIEPVIAKVSQPKCPECGSILIFEGGCNVCKNCGWSKCD